MSIITKVENSNPADGEVYSIQHYVIKFVGDLSMTVQSVFITTKVVNSNTAHVEVYSIQYYVIKVYQQLAAGQRFSPGSLVSSTNKTD